MSNEVICPSPLLCLEVDLRDFPPPRELFITLAMENFGLSRAQAMRLIDEVLTGANRVH